MILTVAQPVAVSVFAGSNWFLETKVTRSCINFSENNDHLRLHLERSKADIKNEGTTILVAAIDSPIYPVRALLQLWALDPQQPSAPLFSFSGQPFTKHRVHRKLNEPPTIEWDRSKRLHPPQLQKWRRSARPKTVVCGMTRFKLWAAGLPRLSRFTSRLPQPHYTPTRCSFRMANLSPLACSQIYKPKSPPLSALLGLGVTGSTFSWLSLLPRGRQPNQYWPRRPVLSPGG
jgi:hypothetical protein